MTNLNSPGGSRRHERFEKDQEHSVTDSTICDFLEFFFDQPRTITYFFTKELKDKKSTTWPATKKERENYDILPVPRRSSDQSPKWSFCICWTSLDNRQRLLSLFYVVHNYIDRILGRWKYQRVEKFNGWSLKRHHVTMRFLLIQS